MKRKKKYLSAGSISEASPGRWKPDGMQNTWTKVLIWAAEGMGKGFDPEYP